MNDHPTIHQAIKALPSWKFQEALASHPEHLSQQILRFPLDPYALTDGSQIRRSQGV